MIPAEGPTTRTVKVTLASFGDHRAYEVGKTQQNDPSLPQTSSEKCPEDKTNLQAEGPTTRTVKVGKTQQNDPSLPQTSSEKCPEDKTNLQAEGPTTRTLKVSLASCGDGRAHEVRGSWRASLYEVLTNESEDLKKKIDSQKGKEILIQGIKGIDAAINPGMPLSCLPENCHVEITFVKSKSKHKKENQIFGRFDHGSGECVKFYIHAIGKERKKIVKFPGLHRKGGKLCIYAFKGETIRQALCKDGRLLPFLKDHGWKLIENADTILESTQLVDDIEERVFEVEFEKRLTRANATENAEPQNRNTTLLNEALVEQYPILRTESQKMIAYLRKDEENSKAFYKVCKTNFGKERKSFTTGAVIKLVHPLLDSVGFMEWDNNGRRGHASCFVFKWPYIFTSQHVLRMLVGEGIEVRDWNSIISRSAKVTFNYYKTTIQENDCFYIDPSFLKSDATLDYAVLKLKENAQVISPGLCDKFNSTPPNGLVYIIGHPDGNAKEIDHCFVIPLSQREEKCEQRVKNGGPFVHMYTRKSFQGIVNNPNVITYDTFFYFGSSGSPVFDSSGALVAIHNAGFAFIDERGMNSIIEFGSSMISILCDIYHCEDGRQWFDEIKVDLSEYLPKDVEMVSEEED
ncbi:serine protease FAM111A-like [Talpa occidentalis]|uniref:serine protease FAM111A-like n=1 Tax=Talpa occidentalis TaxID=50954 RepID=UPI0023F84782|nr:serine protease FAM111A-like [Talpa occidentalis]